MAGTSAGGTPSTVVGVQRSKRDGSRARQPMPSGGQVRPSGGGSVVRDAIAVTAASGLHGGPRRVAQAPTTVGTGQLAVGILPGKIKLFPTAMLEVNKPKPKPIGKGRAVKL